jgi:hypothetical protein
MSGVVQKHDHVWSAYLAGLGFLAAGVIIVWMLLKFLLMLLDDWARLVLR